MATVTADRIVGAVERKACLCAMVKQVSDPSVACVASFASVSEQATVNIVIVVTTVALGRRIHVSF
jgi:hypothetical protein